MLVRNGFPNSVPFVDFLAGRKQSLFSGSIRDLFQLAGLLMVCGFICLAKPIPTHPIPRAPIIIPIIVAADDSA
jgi:hypothetical protein